MLHIYRDRDRPEPMVNVWTGWGHQFEEMGGGGERECESLIRSIVEIRLTIDKISECLADPELFTGRVIMMGDRNN